MHIVVNILSQKEDLIRIRLAVGGNLIEYPGKGTTNTADLTYLKLHIHSFIYNRGAKYAVWDIGNYYIETPMVLSYYMQIFSRIIPTDIIAHYKINDLVDRNGWVYLEIIQGVYIPPQAGIFAKHLLA